MVWPKWLPVQARLPLIAQITGAVALTALLAAPWWSSIPGTPTAEGTAAATRPVTAPAPAPATSATVPASASVPPASAGPEDLRPAHLNLEVRHSFANVNFSVTVDGKPAFQTTVEGSGKRFKVFGKRSERGYTKTLDLPPGVRVVRVRVLSAEEKFDQTRVERFELGAASVATLRVSADRSGLSLVAERPPAPAPRPATDQAPVQAAVALPPPAVVVPAAAAAVPVPGAPQPTHEANAVVDLLQSMRSILIAIAGFVASAATAVVIEDYLRGRRQRFQPAGATDQQVLYTERRRRRRPGRVRENPEPGVSGSDIGAASASDSGVRGTDPSSATSE